MLWCFGGGVSGDQLAVIGARVVCLVLWWL